MAKYKHLTDDERLLIEHLLKERTSIKKIAVKVGKSASTISREIRARALESEKSAPYRIKNRCVRRMECDVRYLCGASKPNCTKRCSACNLCNALCDEYEEQACERLFDPPYVCNGCMEESRCVLKKRYYLHRKAHEAYRETLIESRIGANITEDELIALDEFVSPLFRRGQSVHHIAVNNPDQFTVSEKSLYRYVRGGLLQAKSIDAPRMCRLKPRKTKPVEHKVDAGCRIGRTYADFKTYLEENDTPVCEIDSVIGRVGGKVLLTIMFRSCDLMLAFIRDRNTSKSVIDVFDRIFDLIGADKFKELFPLILTDNGSEFSNPMALEFDAEENRRTTIFYCDPCASYQKPAVELNHEFIRRILPKGKSFDELTQDDVNLMMSHVNSYTREKLNDKTPFDTFGFLYGYDVLNLLGLSRIAANEILLKPSLLKKKQPT